MCFQGGGRSGDVVSTGRLWGLRSVEGRPRTEEVLIHLEHGGVVEPPEDLNLLDDVVEARLEALRRLVLRLALLLEGRGRCACGVRGDAGGIGWAHGSPGA